jgi:hypothetical protein
MTIEPIFIFHLRASGKSYNRAAIYCCWAVALIQDLNIASIHCAVTIGNSLDGSVAKIHLPQKILGQGSFHFRYRMWSKYFLQQSRRPSSLWKPSTWFTKTHGNDSYLCRVGARRVALAVSSGFPRAEHVCPSRPSPNPLCKFPQALHLGGLHRASRLPFKVSSFTSAEHPANATT